MSELEFQRLKPFYKKLSINVLIRLYNKKVREAISINPRTRNTI